MLSTSTRSTRIGPTRRKLVRWLPGIPRGHRFNVCPIVDVGLIVIVIQLLLDAGIIARSCWERGFHGLGGVGLRILVGRLAKPAHRLSIRVFE